MSQAELNLFFGFTVAFATAAYVGALAGLLTPLFDPDIYGSYRRFRNVAAASILVASTSIFGFVLVASHSIYADASRRLAKAVAREAEEAEHEANIAKMAPLLFRSCPPEQR